MFKCSSSTLGGDLVEGFPSSSINGCHTAHSLASCTQRVAELIGVVPFWWTAASAKYTYLIPFCGRIFENVMSDFVRQQHARPSVHCCFRLGTLYLLRGMMMIMIFKASVARNCLCVCLYHHGHWACLASHQVR